MNCLPEEDMNKGFALIILVILIALAGAVGVVIVKELRNSNPSPAINPSPSTTPSPAQTPLPTRLNVTDIMSNPETYAGKKVKVKGKLVLHTYDSARPCPATDPSCNTEIKPPTLHLVNPAAPWVEVIDLYKKSSAGYVQISCQSRENSTCGQYKVNTETTLEGLFTKEQVPYQQIGNSTGKIETIKYKDHFFLVVD